jgi:hypothetical protein
MIMQRFSLIERAARFVSFPSRSHYETRLRGDVWPPEEDQRRHPAEAVVGPLGVVGVEPGVSDRPYLVDGIEEVGVEDLFSIAAIEALDEALDEGVLIPGWMCPMATPPP